MIFMITFLNYIIIFASDEKHRPDDLNCVTKFSVSIKGHLFINILFTLKTRKELRRGSERKREKDDDDDDERVHTVN